MQIVFTRMLSAAYSLASDLVRLSPAARVTDVGRARGNGALPPTVVMLTMRPPPRCFMWGITRRDIRTAPMTLRSQSACQRSSSTFSKAAAAEVPALLSRMSTPPHCATTASTSRSQSAARLTSATWASTWPPVALRIWSAACSRCSLRRAQMATFAPSAASFSAAARPRPSLPPVMMAILPFRPRSSMESSSSRVVVGGAAPLLVQEGLDHAGCGLRLLQVGSVAGSLHDLDASLHQPAGELVRVRERDQPVVLPPDQQRGRLDAVDSLLQPLVGNRPDELAGAPHGPGQTGPCQGSVLRILGDGEQRFRRHALRLPEHVP